jgi:nucleoid-associated protein EbfC
MSFKMLKQVQQLQAKMAKVQEELAQETVEATAGGGAVKAVVNGEQKLVSVAIDPEAAEDVEMLQDLIVAAVNEASDKAKELAAQRMGELTSALGLPPGLI